MDPDRLHARPNPAAPDDDPIEVGVYTFSTDLSMPPARFAAEVENRGFSRLLYPEHSHIPVARATAYPETYGGGELPDFYQRTYDPFVAASFAMTSTTTLLIGTGVCLLALRDPIDVAKKVASIDHLSGGRFVFGVGFGWNRDEFANHGVDFTGRHRLVAEKVALMKELWTRDVASYSGDRVSLTSSWAWPKPRQRPHPPVLLGGNGPTTMRHAASWADVWYPTGPLDDPDLTLSAPRFRQLVADAGRDPDQVQIGLAPAQLDEKRLETLIDNGISFCNVAAVADDESELLRQLDTLAAVRDRVLGAR